jgi:hypothetical protein
MSQRSIFKNTPTKSYLPSDIFIHEWEGLLQRSGYVKNRKGPLEVFIFDDRIWGLRLVDRCVQVEYRIHLEGLEILVKEDITLEEFEKKAETILNKLRKR